MATLGGFSRLLAPAVVSSLRRVFPAAVCKETCASSKLLECGVAGCRTKARVRGNLPWMVKVPQHQVDVTNWDKEKEQLANDVIKEINRQIAEDKTGRLFAVVHICGKQFKVTENDIIIVEGFWPPSSGDELKLEKVLLVGSSDFTLIGRPILNRELVSIDATVIEKTLSHTKTKFRMVKRKQFKRINFYRVQHTMLRINNISINGSIDKKKEVEGLDRIY